MNEWLSRAAGGDLLISLPSEGEKCEVLSLPRARYVSTAPRERTSSAPKTCLIVLTVSSITIITITTITIIMIMFISSSSSSSSAEDLDVLEAVDVVDVQRRPRVLV